jgi:CO/xanthine dehydrogenase Mo-binding subunit
VVNPDGLKAQIEGGIVQSSSWTLKEQVRFSKRQRESRDWNSYPIMRFDEVPEVDVILIDRPNEKSLGVGETAQGPTAAAIANAIFHATGKRLRQLPFTSDRFE